jgi:hypothetical protein
MHTNDNRLEAAEKSTVPRMSFPMGTAPNMTILIDDMPCLVVGHLDDRHHDGRHEPWQHEQCDGDAVPLHELHHRGKIEEAHDDDGGVHAQAAHHTSRYGRPQGDDGVDADPRWRWPAAHHQLAPGAPQHATSVLLEVEEAEVHDQMTYLSMV